MPQGCGIPNPVTFVTGPLHWPAPMHVVLVSKALVTEIYQGLVSEIGRCGVELTMLCPPYWQDSRGRHELSVQPSPHYRLQVVPMRLNGNYHLHYYPDLAQRLRALKPDLLHMDEEAYNLATWLGFRHARHLDIPALFFTWQNLERRYPPPFRGWERAVYRQARHALAGSRAAMQVLRHKGYAGPVTVNPQMGVDTALFTPQTPPVSQDRYTIGYAGGLVPEKGLDILIQACATLAGDWQLQLVGSGRAEKSLRRMVTDRKLDDHVRFLGRHPGREMPNFYRSLDVFVLPSRTRRNWSEQFGRVLIEAMSCAVPVVVSDSGEGRHVVGEVGLVYPEADAAALTAHLQTLQNAPLQRKLRGRAGRTRVLSHFSMQKVAAKIVEVYAQILADNGTAS